ncbi:MAG: hypothetical protein COV44_04565 [Deltaproteobacteria bacterium CG11_big_fil_rev_8_21_14_0_20_45_16]|nr:MAG: hypothetical protein COV44_04565 [Deltaproteobacteria bacterium CG11_big_fil_rev_8_21_14_0_20_45_16]
MKSFGHKGVGLRPPHYKDILSNPSSVDWCEVISENYMDTGGRPLSTLLKVREMLPIALHGVSLNIGSSDVLNRDYLKNLKLLVEGIEPFIVSDHLCWTGIEKRNWHDLLPLPMNESTVDSLVSRIDQVQETLGRRIALENISTYVRFQSDELDEADFIRLVVERADCDLLLDVNNVFVNSVNHNFDPYEYLKKMPADRVVQYHLAGHTDKGDFLFDTHDAEVSDPVWDLFQFTWNKIGARPFLIEWDDKIPEFERLVQEVEKANEMTKGLRAEKEYAI